MPIFNDPALIREIIMDHYEYPRNKGLKGEEGYLFRNMNSESCIDNIDMEVKINDGVIEDVRFDGVACTISTASTSILTEMMKDKTIDEAKNIINNYLAMLHGESYDEELLGEANAFVNTSKQANRIKCATIAWNGLKDLLEENK